MRPSTLPCATRSTLSPPERHFDAGVHRRRRVQPGGIISDPEIRQGPRRHLGLADFPVPAWTPTIKTVSMTKRLAILTFDSSNTRL
jgi:hypothetical protein